MAAPTITELRFDSGSNRIFASATGGNGNLYHKLSVSRGTVARVPTGLASTFGGRGAGPGPNPIWNWTDNWPGQGEGPPLYIDLKVFDYDGRFAESYISQTIASSALTTVTGPAVLGGGLDDTSSLQTAINNCPDHRRFIFQGNYQNLGYITVLGRTDLILDMQTVPGAGITQTTCGASPRGLLEIGPNTGTSTPCTAVSVWPGTITGFYQAGVCDYNTGNLVYGIRVWSATDGWIKTGGTFSNITDDNIYFSQYAENPSIYPQCARWTVESFTNTTRTDRQGMSIVDGVDIWFIKPILSNMRFNILDLEQNHSDQTIQRIFVMEPQCGAMDSGFMLGCSSDNQTSDVTFYKPTRYGTAFNVLGANIACTGNKKQNFYFYNPVSTSQSLSPKGLYNDIKNVKGLFIQSAQQSYHVSGKHAVQMSNGCGQFRLFDSTFTGDTAPYYSDDGTGKDLVQA